MAGIAPQDAAQQTPRRGEFAETETRQGARNFAVVSGRASAKSALHKPRAAVWRPSFSIERADQSVSSENARTLIA